MLSEKFVEAGLVEGQLPLREESDFRRIRIHADDVKAQFGHASSVCGAQITCSNYRKHGLNLPAPRSHQGDLGFRMPGLAFSLTP